MTSRWVLVLGASSGFGAATCRAFAREGYGILGVHLDRPSKMEPVDELVAELSACGVPVHFFNVNAADDVARAATVEAMKTIVGATPLTMLLHSLAFGTLSALVDPGGVGIRRRQLEMTLDVMANTLVFWAQDLARHGMLQDTRIFAMTSSGNTSVWDTYGAVSAAKAALEAYIRQLAYELAPLGCTANAILAGVTDTPALSKIPHHQSLKDKALSKNPHNRLTRPEDVASCLVALASPGTHWMTGNVIRVDGGEDVCA